MKNFIRMFVIVSLVLTSSVSSQACTAFLVGGPDNMMVGRNLDWGGTNAYAVRNPRGVKKMGVPLSVLPSHVWTSKYASLTFNSAGLENPVSGVNETGLVGVILWLDESDPQTINFKTELTEFQWLQWLLDTSATVAEVEMNVKKVRLHQVFTQLHYWFCDSTSKCILVEHLEKKIKISHYDNKPVRVVANNTFDESFQYLAAHAGFGGTLPIPQGPDTLSRFVRASSLTKGVVSMTPNQVFSTLDKVAQHGELDTSTDWQEVYDMKAKRVYFRSARNSNIKYINFDELDWSCSERASHIDLSMNLSDDVTELMAPLKYEDNLLLIRDTAKSLPVAIPDWFIQYFAWHPYWGTYCRKK